MHDQCLVRVLGDINGQTNERQILLPKTFRGDIFNLCHEIPDWPFWHNENPGKNPKKFYWSAMTDDVTLWVRQCDQCAARKGPPKIRRAPLQLYQVGNPWDRIALDIPLIDFKTTLFHICRPRLSYKVARGVSALLLRFRHRRRNSCE